MTDEQDDNKLLLHRIVSARLARAEKLLERCTGYIYEDGYVEWSLMSPHVIKLHREIEELYRTFEDMNLVWMTMQGR